MCLVVTCCERADVLALVCGVQLWVCHFPIGILAQVWYLIVSIPDLCTLTYLKRMQPREIHKIWHLCQWHRFHILWISCVPNSIRTNTFSSHGSDCLLHDSLVCTIITVRVHPSVRGQSVKKLITLEPHGIFHQIMHTFACQQYLSTGMCNSLFMDEGLLRIISVSLWSVS